MPQTEVQLLRDTKGNRKILVDKNVFIIGRGRHRTDAEIERLVVKHLLKRKLKRKANRERSERAKRVVKRVVKKRVVKKREPAKRDIAKRERSEPANLIPKPPKQKPLAFLLQTQLEQERKLQLEQLYQYNLNQHKLQTQVNEKEGQSEKTKHKLIQLQETLGKQIRERDSTLDDLQKQITSLKEKNTTLEQQKKQTQRSIFDSYVQNGMFDTLRIKSFIRQHRDELGLSTVRHSEFTDLSTSQLFNLMVINGAISPSKANQIATGQLTLQEAMSQPLSKPVSMTGTPTKTPLPQEINLPSDSEQSIPVTPSPPSEGKFEEESPPSEMEGKGCGIPFKKRPKRKI